MKLSAVIAPLIAAKVPHDLIMDTILAFEAQQIDALERRRESDRKRQTDKRSRDVTLRHSDRILTTRAEASSSNQEISEKEGKKESTSPPARSTRGTRIPDDFKPDIDAAVADGLSRQEAERQALSFCDYWRAKPGAAALKLDWPATWRTWFRRRIDEKPNSAARPYSNAPPAGQAFNDILDNLQGKNRNDAFSGPTVDASDNGTDRGRAANLVQLHALSARR